MEKTMFIKTVPEAEAEGKILEIYQGDIKSMGYVPNHAKVFSLRPDVLDLEQQLSDLLIHFIA